MDVRRRLTLVILAVALTGASCDACNFAPTNPGDPEFFFVQWGNRSSSVTFQFTPASGVGTITVGPKEHKLDTTDQLIGIDGQTFTFTITVINNLGFPIPTPVTGSCVLNNVGATLTSPREIDFTPDANPAQFHCVNWGSQP